MTGLSASLLVVAAVLAAAAVTVLLRAPHRSGSHGEPTTGDTQQADEQEHRATPALTNLVEAAVVPDCHSPDGTEHAPIRASGTAEPRTARSDTSSPG